MKRRKQFKDLVTANKNLTYSRYFRLMSLASIELCCTVPISAYSVYLNVTTAPGIMPYKGWADTHFNYSQVIQLPRVLYSQDQTALVSIELTRWLLVVCAIIFFGFFGFADEAKRHYRIAYGSMAKIVGSTVGSTTIGSFASPTSPSYVLLFTCLIKALTSLFQLPRKGVVHQLFPQGEGQRDFPGVGHQRDGSLSRQRLRFYDIILRQAIYLDIHR